MYSVRHGSGYNASFIVILLLALLFISSRCQVLNEKEFPNDFLFGVATSAYQIEGGHDADGKGENIWDHYLKLNPELVHNKSNGNVACNSYHLYKEDVKLLKNLGVQFYRFSISWSRILPKGYSYKINPKGVMYYNNLIDELLANNIQPMVTMYHWDLPQPLQDIGGWTNPYMAYYFEDYARVLFENFGDRVKYWITISDACDLYGKEGTPPLLYQPGITEYLCNHVTLLAHAKVYHLYDEEYRPQQHGQVGITIDARWFSTGSEDLKDYEAADRAKAFKIGLLADPIFHPEGDYPEVVKKRIFEESKKEGFLRSRLPSLSQEEKDYIAFTYDYLGLNLYTTYMVKHVPESNSTEPSVDKDMQAELFQDESWQGSAAPWLKVVPWGLTHALVWCKHRYDNPDIIITENGFADDGTLDDFDRIEYLRRHLSAVLDAIYNYNVNVKGYAVWSLMDNFEWTDGYSIKFGLYHVDFNDPKRTRTPKTSAVWYKDFLSKRKVTTERPKTTNKSKGLKGEL